MCGCASVVYLYLPSCRVLSFSASLCCFLQGIWRSLTLPSKSVVFAIYSPPPSYISSPPHLLFISPQFYSSSLPSSLPLLPKSHLCFFSLISCLILFSGSPTLFVLPDHISTPPPRFASARHFLFSVIPLFLHFSNSVFSYPCLFSNLP